MVAAAADEAKIFKPLEQKAGVVDVMLDRVHGFLQRVRQFASWPIGGVYRHRLFTPQK
jgi:hypothetical protein